MRQFVFMMLVLLGGATSSLQAQNSWGIRVGSFDPTFTFQKDTNSNYSRFDGNLSAQVVRDWAKGDAGFWRGRLGLSLYAAADPLGNQSYYNRSSQLYTSVSLGRGHRIDLAPFAFSFGGEVGIGFSPYTRRKSYNVSNLPGLTTELTQISRNFQGSLGAGMFLQLDWNIHRNIWIGVEQRFLASVVYRTGKLTRTTNSTPDGGSTTTTTEINTQKSFGFAHPFQIPSPLFSVTFRPGGN